MEKAFLMVRKQDLILFLGNGNASKEQVASMLKSLLNLKELPKHLDATDGLAAAVCHHFQKNNSTSTKSYTGWKSFITDNPKKVK